MDHGKVFAVVVIWTLASIACMVAPDARTAVARFRTLMTAKVLADRRLLAPLKGKNLACWCKPGEPCHADVLLELANP